MSLCKVFVLIQDFLWENLVALLGSQPNLCTLEFSQKKPVFRFSVRRRSKIEGGRRRKNQKLYHWSCTWSGRYRSSLFFVQISLHTCKPIRMCVIEVLQLGSTSTTCDSLFSLHWRNKLYREIPPQTFSKAFLSTIFLPKCLTGSIEIANNKSTSYYCISSHKPNPETWFCLLISVNLYMIFSFLAFKNYTTT